MYKRQQLADAIYETLDCQGVFILSLIHIWLKPIYWSPVTETALAEAEIEYKNVSSPSIYVKMKANQDLLDRIGMTEETWVVIWTTTPWTLPANVAISLNPDLEYGVYKTEKGNLVLGKDLAEQAFSAMEIENYELIKEFVGRDIERTTYQHPFLDLSLIHIWKILWRFPISCHYKWRKCISF